MKNAEEIFDKSYCHGNIDPETREQMRREFIEEVGAYLALPRAEVINLEGVDGYAGVFLAYAYIFSRASPARNMRTTAYAVTTSGVIHVFVGSWSCATRSSLLQKILQFREQGRKQVDELRSHPARTFRGWREESSASLVPYGTHLFGYAQHNASSYCEVVAKFGALTKSGSRGRARRLWMNGCQMGVILNPEKYALAVRFREFRKTHLQQDILHTQAKLGGLQTTIDYNWFAAEGVLQVKARRIQAASVFPLFADWMRWKFSEVIDSGAPLLEAMSKQFDLPVAQVRRLRGITNQMAGLRGEDIDRLLGYLRDIPSFPLPGKQKEWRLLNYVMSYSPYFVESVALAGYDNVVKLCAKREHHAHALIDQIKDYLEATLHGGKASGHGQELAVSLMQFVSRIGFCRWVEITDKYHRRRRESDQRFQTAILREYERIGVVHWPRLFQDQQLGRNGEVTLRVITTQAELETEGAEMGHCVAGYGEYCLSGSSHIAALSCGSGASAARATAEFVVRDGKLVLRQLYRERNETPDGRIAKAVRQFVKDVNRGAISIDIERYREELRVHSKQVESIRAKENLAAAARDREVGEMARGLLPASVRALFHNKWRLGGLSAQVFPCGRAA